jgi:hypothetical protein
MKKTGSSRPKKRSANEKRETRNESRPTMTFETQKPSSLHKGQQSDLLIENDVSCLKKKVATRMHRPENHAMHLQSYLNKQTRSANGTKQTTPKASPAKGKEA